LQCWLHNIEIKFCCFKQQSIWVCSFSIRFNIPPCFQPLDSVMEWKLQCMIHFFQNHVTAFTFVEGIPKMEAREDHGLIQNLLSFVPKKRCLVQTQHSLHITHKACLEITILLLKPLKYICMLYNKSSQFRLDTNFLLSNDRDQIRLLFDRNYFIYK